MKRFDASTHSQQQRLLARLKRGSVSTVQARRDEDIPHPAGRVQELRRKGWNIITEWTICHTEAGGIHKFAKYILLSQKRKEAN
jgi:hypothetical protein